MNRFFIYIALLIGITGGIHFPLFAQLNYTPSGASNILGTYTDLGVSGTVISTGGNFDDANSAPQNIGFTFNFNGTAFTQFVLNTNGFIKLGNTNPSVPNLFAPNTTPIVGGALNSTATADTNIIAPFNCDWQAGINSEYRTATSGLIGSRICTIQFKNIRDKQATPLLSNAEFQIKLYESSNIVEFIYGSWATIGGNVNSLSASGGLKGKNNSATQVVVISSSFNTVVFLTQSSVGITIVASNPPTLGRTFRFEPGNIASATDADVRAVYTLGHLPQNNGSPHIVTALVQNAGASILSNLPVTLTISGANAFSNTQTIASLPVGFSQLVTFAPFSPSALGQNTVTVSVPSDINPSNDAAAARQTVTGDTYNYADDLAVSGAPVGYGTASGLLLSKFRMNGSNTVRGVRAYLANNPATAGKALYAVLLTSSGLVIAQSPSFAPQVSDLNQYRLFEFAFPIGFANADFYAGIAQPASAVAYFPLATQPETPTRNGAFYSSALTGGELSEVTTFGRFAIEAVLGLTVPVELTSFRVEPQGATARLYWTTATEQNNLGFEIERGSQETPFTKIGFVKGNGTTTEVKTYSFTDNSLASGNRKYRLKQTDFDGKFTYSPEVEIFAGVPQRFSLSQNYPNPFNPNTTVAYTLPTASTVSLKVYDMLGREAATLVNQNQPAGSYSVLFDASRLASGVYLYRLQTEEFSEIKKMMLLK